MSCFTVSTIKLDLEKMSLTIFNLNNKNISCNNMELYSYEDYSKTSDKSIHNRCIIEKSKVAGCYYCLKLYDASLINEYVDIEDDTAVCPYCHVDSVLGDADGLPKENTTIYLQYMRWYGFDHICNKDGSIRAVKQFGN